MVKACVSRLTPTRMMVLFVTINIICYMDRGIIPGAPTSFSDFITATMHTEETGTLFGALNSVFIIGYSAASLIVGHMVHTTPPMRVIGYGLTVHAIAVFLSGYAYYVNSYWVLAIARCLSGVGEASFCSIAPTFIDDKISSEYKGRCVSLFYVAIPVGIGGGYVFAGQIATYLGWQWAFFLQLIPFVPCTIACFFLDEFKFNPAKRRESSSKDSLQSHPNMIADLKTILSSPLYVLTVLGEASFSFVFAGLSAFAPELVLDLGFFDTEATASLYFGIVTTISGILGSVLGGILFDRFGDATNDNSKLRIGFLQQAVYAVLGFVAMILAPWATNTGYFFATIFVGLCVCTASYTPTLFVVVRTVPEHSRSLALGFQNMMLHVLGDVPSPVIIGAIKDALAPSSTKIPGTDKYNSDGIRGLRTTCFLIILWLLWMVLFWVAAYVYYRMRPEPKVDTLEIRTEGQDKDAGVH